MVEPPQDMHVMPEFEKHEASAGCWCQPVQEVQSNGASVWIHRLRLLGMNSEEGQQDG